MINRVKLKLIIRAAHPGFQVLQPQERPAIELRQVRRGDPVSHGIEIIQVAEHKPGGVADFSVGFDEMIEDLW